MRSEILIRRPVSTVPANPETSRTELKIMPLARAALLKNRSATDILERAAKGELCLCIRVTTEVGIYSVQSDTLERLGIERRLDYPWGAQGAGSVLGEYWLREAEADYLRLQASDCREVLRQASFLLKTFSTGYRVKGRESPELIYPAKVRCSHPKRGLSLPVFTTHDGLRSTTTTVLAPFDPPVPLKDIEVMLENLWVAADELDKVAALTDPMQLTPDQGAVGVGAGQGSAAHAHPKADKSSETAKGLIGRNGGPAKSEAIIWKEFFEGLVSEIKDRAKRAGGEFWPFDPLAAPGQALDVYALACAWAQKRGDLKRANAKESYLRDKKAKIICCQPNSSRSTYYELLFPELKEEILIHRSRLEQAKQVRGGRANGGFDRKY
jgi:hypothetical protein